MADVLPLRIPADPAAPAAPPLVVDARLKVAERKERQSGDESRKAVAHAR